MQNKTTGAQEMDRILNLLYNIEDYIFIEDFHKIQLSGDKVADVLLTQVSQMLLEKLKSEGMIKVDNLTSKNAKIYGLTKKGIDMYKLFQELSYKK